MRLPFLRSSRETDPALANALDRIADRLDRLVALGERTNELLERLEVPSPSAQPDLGDRAKPATAADASTESSSGATPRSSRRQAKPSRPRRQQKPRDAPKRAAVEAPRKLHEAIIQVLLDAGEPLTASDLAARIRERNLFEPPRSGHELRGGQVSARVGNGHYRDRFVRQDGRIWLADPDVERLRLAKP